MRARTVALGSLATLLLAGWASALSQVQDLQLNCIRPVYIVAEDFDRDGWVDLAIACHSCNQVLVVPNLARSGKECAAFANGLAWPLLYAGQGDAPLALATGWFLDAVPPSRPLVFHDIFPHLVVVTQYTPGIVRITPLSGTPPTGPWVSWSISGGAAVLFQLPGNPPPVYPAHVVLGDFNKDGRPDIAIADPLAGGGGVFVYLSPAGALPPLYSALNAQAPVAPAAMGQPVFIPVPGARFLAVADFDRDGNMDIAVATGGNVKFLCGNGAGEFNTGLPSVLVGQTVTSLAVADFDRDGDPDLVATDPDLGAVSVLWNTGCWTFKVVRIKSEKAYFVHVFDANRDGILDIAVAQKDLDRVSIYSGAITSVGPITGTQVANCPACTILADIMTFNLCRTFQFAAGSRPIGLASGDFDNNGVPDLAVIHNGFPGPGVPVPASVIYNPICCVLCNGCQPGQTRAAPCCPGGTPGECGEPQAGEPPKG